MIGLGRNSEKLRSMAAGDTNGSYAGWFQRIDATHALKRSAGVSYPSGLQVFATVSSNGSNAQIVIFAKFGGQPEADFGSVACRCSAASPERTLISGSSFPELRKTSTREQGLLNRLIPA